MGIWDLFKRKQNPDRGAAGRILRYDRSADSGTIVLERGGQVDFVASACMFTPFDDLQVLVERTNASGACAEQVRLAELEQGRYVELLEVRAQEDEQAQQQQQQRYRAELRARATREVIDAGIEARLEQDPDDLEAYQVYADLLQERGEPLGELIALEHTLARTEQGARRDELQREVERRRAEHVKAMGLVPTQVRVEWHLGLIDGARVAVNWPEGGDFDEMLDEGLIVDLLAAPATRFMRRLTFGLLSFEPEEGGIFTLLEQAGPLTALRELHVADFNYPDEMEMSWYELGSEPPPYAALPNLRKLVLQAGQLELGSIDLPRLEHFEVRTGGLRRANIESICAARWPDLRTLIVWFGNESYGAEGTIADVAPILAAEGLDHVTSLGLCNADFTDALCGRLPGAPILPQLRALDLSLGTMSDEGAQRLAAARDKLAHLERLDVSQNCLTPAGVAALETIGCEVIAGDQDDVDPEDRYVSVGE